MTATTRLFSAAALSFACLVCGCASHASGRGEPAAATLREADIRDKIRGAWLGQMIGVTWGFPTEFYARYIWQLFPDFHRTEHEPANLYTRYEGGPIPLDELPVWEPSFINGGYTQDDLYVEVPFMETLRDHGVNADWHLLGEAFKQSQFPLYHANLAARDNLRKGLSPPDSGHFHHNQHADDIDWQIEADFVGLMCPGQPRTAAEIAFRLGHIMNHGDGVYGGVFVATMIARAFTADSVETIANVGRRAVPQGSGYRAVLDQVYADWKAGVPYETNLKRLYRKWGTDDRCPEWFAASDPLNIDAKLNGAFILLGLLYGEGDLASSMRYAMAAGQDSDCNPANVGSILGAFYGARALAADETDWLSALNNESRFQTTTYTLNDLTEMNTELARQVTVMRGGKAPRNRSWEIGPETAADLLLEQWPHKSNRAPSLRVNATVEDRLVRFMADASDADGPVTVQWHFGDLSFATGPEALHTYAQPGTYQVVVFAADRHGSTTIRELPVVISSAP